MMKKILSTGYTNTAFDLAIFLLRVAVALMMCLNHGIPKLVHFSEWKVGFFDPFHIGHRWSLVLSIIAEVFASLLLILGLFTRIAAFVLVFEMCVIVFVFQYGQPVSRFEDAILFLAGFLTILLVGPGRVSADAMAGK